MGNRREFGWAGAAGENEMERGGRGAGGAGGCRREKGGGRVMGREGKGE